ncbi:MAG: hypothetical protein OZ948_06490 [Deltaproteobacteria bacterium]|nr:hypothetical protein [Deltaproteobacteria bacterium]
MRAVSFALVPLLLLTPRPAGSAGCATTLLTPHSHARLVAVVCEEALAGLPACNEALFDQYLDPSSGLEVPPDQRETIPATASLLANALAGGNALAQAALAALFGVAVPTVPLNVDPCDDQLANSDSSPGAPCSGIPARGPHAAFAALGPTLNLVLTDEQEALLGCGPFWGDDCEGTGIEPRSAPASALAQAWVGFDGSCAGSEGSEDWHLANGEPQPGTIGFAHPPLPPQPAGAVATGMRSPFLPDGTTPNPIYDANRDGTIGGLVIPAEFGASAGQPFANEVAALSFNLQLLPVVLSASADVPELDQFDPADPYAYYDENDPETAGDRGRCSFLQPQHCRAVRTVLAPEADASQATAAALTTLGAVLLRRRARRTRARAARRARGVRPPASAPPSRRGSRDDRPRSPAPRPAGSRRQGS